jgi:predicted O-linked N-acetylglucosamine transferase (SPINDLY family)
MSRPDLRQAFDLALQHHQGGRLSEAEAIYRELLEHESFRPDALHLLGLIQLQRERPEEAVTLIRQAIALRSTEASYHGNLGVALTSLGQYDEAVVSLRHALELQPNFANAYYNLGRAFAAQRAPSDALLAYRAAIRLQPDLAVAHNNLGVILLERRHVGEAAAAFRRAIELAPAFAEAHCNLANALKDSGLIHEALAGYRRAMELEPQNSLIGSNLVHALLYSPDCRPAELAAESRAWHQRHAALWRRSWPAHPNSPDPHRPLRVGYVSADFSNHVVGRTFLPVFEAHDHTQFEIVLYSAHAPSDEAGERFRRRAAQWREVGALSDDALAATVREDRIDLLVDLSLRTAGNRLLLFARKPAPVQLSWLGYPGATGLEAMDYRVTDRFLDPPAENTQYEFEEPLRLPDAWCCYGAPSHSPGVQPPPAAQNGCITFGSCNYMAKINDRVLSTWAKILRRVENARLLLLAPEGRRADLLAFFQRQGLDPARVEIVAPYPSSEKSRDCQTIEYLLRYHRIDIALDPYPYNGMTTTCDALWMGVPVVALIGETTLGRASYSLLSNVGLPELAVPTEEDYVRLAVELAGDVPQLTELRATLRERMQNSPLLDAPRFARHLEAAFRTVWQRWCAKRM